MIVSFGDAATEDVFNGVPSARARAFPADILPRAVRMLDRLNAAAALGDMAVPPSNNLEKLKGKLKAYHSVRVNAQWRIIFIWTDAGPAEVKLTDYH